jgi:hypothetical protein
VTCALVGVCSLPFPLFFVLLAAVSLRVTLEPTRGVEPRTSSLPRMRSNHLSYVGDPALLRCFELRIPAICSELERETGLEPATPSLEGSRSSQLSYSRVIPFDRPADLDPDDLIDDLMKRW